MKTCEHCYWWKKDWGLHCMNGWTGAGRKDGHCCMEPERIYKAADDGCSRWEDANFLRQDK